jgi:ADP-ribosylglycohydrolase
MKRILLEGGDTDTNAAIVGGMFGALVGFKSLPPHYIDKILDFDNNSPKGIPQTMNKREPYLLPKFHMC